MVTRPTRSLVPHVCGVFVLALLALSPTIASAVTFNWSVDCPTDVVLGPITVKAITFAGTVDAQLNVPVTLALLPSANLIIQNNNAAPQGTFTGTVSCTLTFGGVTVPFTQSLTLEVPPAGPTGFGNITISATSVIVNLGLQGVVTVSAPLVVHLGFDRTFPNGFILAVPFLINTTVLLTLPTVPTLSTWAWMLMLAVLLGSALFFLRRRVA